MQGYMIQLGGETFQVEILSDPRQDEVEVRVDGKTLTVNVSRLEKAITPPQRNPVAPPASGSALTPSGSPGVHPAPTLTLAGSPNGGDTVTSPLPGTIIEVAVRPGQAIRTGEELLVIEAMKMNNRIRSPRDGTIGEVLVQVGEQVSHGAPLVVWAT